MSENLVPGDSIPTRSDQMRVRVSNIGGIENCDVSFEPGVTILTGQNATNRTSLIKAIDGIFGGSKATLKSDADSGFVELDIGDETYRREYARDGQSVTVDGTPFSDRADLVDSFACLVEDNPARRAVQQGSNLQDVLMDPVDTDDIERQIRAVESEISELESRIDRIGRRRDRLSELEKDRGEVEAELSEVEAEIERVETEIDAHDADESEAQEAERLLDDLEAARSKRRRTNERLQRQDEQLESLRTKRDDLESQLESLTVPDERLSEVESEIQRLEERKRAYQDDIATLTEVIQFNDQLLSDDGPTIAEPTDDGVTAALDPTAGSTECWTCGSTVELSRIEERLDGMREMLREKRSERDELDNRIADLQSERRELQQEFDEQSELESTLDEVEREIDHREQKATDLRATLDELEEEIAGLEADVEANEELRESGLADAYQRRSELEYERGQLQQRLTNIDEEISDIEDELEQRPSLEQELAEKREQQVDLRTRVEDLERETVERFNDQMEAVLEVLEYDNIARIWIERKGTGGASEWASERFEIHVVRETPEGAAYEDVLHNLSESERELIGLVVALVGYLVHEVYDEVPVMLLDSLEAIDADRIARLIDYLADFAPYLVVALLPEDESAVATDYARIDSRVI